MNYEAQELVIKLYVFYFIHGLSLKPNDLVQLEAERRTDLKWNFLLERCKFYVKVIISVGLF